MNKIHFKFHTKQLLKSHELPPKSRNLLQIFFKYELSLVYLPLALPLPFPLPSVAFSYSHNYVTTPMIHFKTFPSPQKETQYPLVVTPHSPSPLPWRLLMYFLDLSILDNSYKRNCTICGFLCLIVFST